MTDSYVQVQPDAAGKKLQTFKNTVGVEEVHSEAMTLVDSAGSALKTDDEELVTIDKVHYEIHEGEHYTAIVADGDVDIASPKYISLTAPNTATRIHLFFTVSADNGFLLQLYENPTLNAAGSAVAAYNNDRNSVNAATLVLKEDCTTQAPNNDGTLIMAQYAGGGTNPAARSSGTGASRSEWILAQAEEYIIKITTSVDNSKANALFEWYEES